MLNWQPQRSGQFNGVCVIPSPLGGIKSVIPVFNREAVPMARASAGLCYPRKSGKGLKPLVSVPVDPANPILDLCEPLWGYDAVFAIDTNTRIVGSSKVSIAVAIQLLRCGKEVVAHNRTIPSMAFEFHDVSSKQENWAWKQLCERLAWIATRYPHARVGIVVDSDYGRLPAMNARQIPVVGEWYLPGTFEFMFASSDTPNDSLLNRMIRECHDRSGQLFEEVELRRSPRIGTQEAAPGDPWTRWRFSRWDQREPIGGLNPSMQVIKPDD